MKPISQYKFSRVNKLAIKENWEYHEALVLPRKYWLTSKESVWFVEGVYHTETGYLYFTKQDNSIKEYYRVKVSLSKSTNKAYYGSRHAITILTGILL